MFRKIRRTVCRSCRRSLFTIFIIVTWAIAGLDVVLLYYNNPWTVRHPDLLKKDYVQLNWGRPSTEKIGQMDTVPAASLDTVPAASLDTVPAASLDTVPAASSASPGESQLCNLTDEDRRLFPHCEEKLQWMNYGWASDPCYKAFGVDGSKCSFLYYLSEVESWCPRKRANYSLPGERKPEYANVTTNLQGLLDLLKDPNERHAYAWIRLRVARLWPKWVQAIHSLTAKQDFSKRTKHRILLHLGLLTKQSGIHLAETQFRGAPLGELVQWSDLISVLYILGHQLTITSEVEQLSPLLHQGPGPGAMSSCQTNKRLSLTIIYTDLTGLTQIKPKMGSSYSKLRCVFRILDSFGTEPAFNHQAFAKANNILSSWGGRDLNPQQFFTMFPHSPDNSFMGFAVEHHLNDTVEDDQERKDIAVVYGKNEYMWEGKEAYLDVIKHYLEIHGTVSSEKGNSKLPPYVINHGILPGPELHQLLRKAKIFVGLGFPYEGPAPLEAIANGAVFLNPRFTPPHSSKNTKFFKGKPNYREVTSQHPYSEVFIGKPHVYTIDISNLTEVHQAVQEALRLNEFRTFTPYEFTEEGMLQRMSAYLQHQQFCNFQHRVARWPPSSALTFVMGHTAQSCAQVCWDRDLICEPSHFLEMNSEATLRNSSSLCSTVSHSANIYYPAVNVDTQECILQDNEMLFSCVGGKDNFRRLCPCRNYIPQQLALCQGCERHDNIIYDGVEQVTKTTEGARHPTSGGARHWSQLCFLIQILRLSVDYLIQHIKLILVQIQ